MSHALSPLKHFAIGMFSAAGMLLVLLFGPVALQTMQTQYWPVLYDWEPVVSQTDGDLFVAGSMRKRWWPACEYVPPPRVLDLDTGRHLAITSFSPGAGQNWLGTDQPRTFGPWMVSGGAGRRLQFYSEHECTPLWRSFSILGVVNTKVKP